nr:T-cell activation Rho GTPase-activating protein-like [Columba livia]
MALGDKSSSSPHPPPPANPSLAPRRPAEPPTVTPAPEEVVLSQGVSPAQQCPPLSPQDLLALLQEHGPSTEGIFRLAAGERATRELREALDSGAQVQLESQPVHLLAAILKEVLRKIPSKLLQAELYQDWMSALHNTSRQERLAGLKE